MLSDNRQASQRIIARWLRQLGLGRMRAVTSSLAPRLDRRKAERFPAALPVILELGSQRICAQLINLGSGGGRLQAIVTPLPQSELLLRCGTITVWGTVAWSRGDQFGLTSKLLNRS